MCCYAFTLETFNAESRLVMRVVGYFVFGFLGVCILTSAALLGWDS
jgi:hypothetical protein